MDKTVTNKIATFTYTVPSCNFVLVFSLFCETQRDVSHICTSLMILISILLRKDQIINYIDVSWLVTGLPSLTLNAINMSDRNMLIVSVCTVTSGSVLTILIWQLYSFRLRWCHSASGCIQHKKRKTHSFLLIHAPLCELLVLFLNSAFFPMSPSFAVKAFWCEMANRREILIQQLSSQVLKREAFLHCAHLQDPSFSAGLWPFI